MAINVQVKARYNESPERLIRRFSKKVRKEGVIDDIKSKMYYEKPSIKRRRKEARSRFLRTLKTENK